MLYLLLFIWDVVLKKNGRLIKLISQKLSIKYAYISVYTEYLPKNKHFIIQPITTKIWWCCCMMLARYNAIKTIQTQSSETTNQCVILSFCFLKIYIENIKFHFCMNHTSAWAKWKITYKVRHWKPNKPNIFKKHYLLTKYKNISIFSSKGISFCYILNCQKPLLSLLSLLLIQFK